jgi:dsRNA-specific ribonuclease
MPPAQRPSQKVPDNPTDRHPVQLLNEMRGPINYELVEKRGENPNCIFVLGASIDGKQYTGEGRNKKDAKKACAVVILKEVHSIVYPVAAPE